MRVAAAAVAAVGLTVSSARASLFEFERTILNPVATEGGHFGGSIARVGQQVLIGARGNNSDAGVVYIFNADGSALQQTLTGPVEGIQFGGSIDSVGNGFVISQVGADNFQGAAHLYEGVGNTLVRSFSTPNPNVQGIDLFGLIVAGIGENVLVSAPEDDANGNNSGAVYLLDSATGSVLHTFSGTSAGDLFGRSIDTVGSNVIIGAQSSDIGDFNTGVAQLYDGVTGDLLLTLEDPSPNDSNFFGFSVAGLGTNVLIGAPGYDPANGPQVDVGRAYLLDGLTGDLLRTLENPDPSTNQFGRSVGSVDGNIFVGAAGGAGRAYLFDGINGDLLQIFENPTPEEFDAFGLSFLVTDSGIFIGADFDNSFGKLNSGAVHFYAQTPAVVPLPAALPLFLSALAGLGLMGWRRRQAGA